MNSSNHNIFAYRVGQFRREDVTNVENVGIG
jgi:hypothetical protein